MGQKAEKKTSTNDKKKEKERKIMARLILRMAIFITGETSPFPF